MTSTKISIVCAKPLPTAVEPQAVRPEPVMADGVCRTDGAAVDLKGGALELLNSQRPTVNRTSMQAGIATPDVTVGVTVGGGRNPRHAIAPVTDAAAPVRDPAPEGSAEPHVAEPSMSVTGADVVVDAADGRLVPEEHLSAADRQALEEVRKTPDASGDAVMTPDRAGLVTAMDTVLAANPELVANAAANNIDKSQLANIIADALWPTAEKSQDGRYAVSLPTYPGAYGRMLDDYLARRPGPAAAAVMDAAAAVAQTAIQGYVAQDMAPGQARRHFFSEAVRLHDANAAHYANPDVRARLADPAAADRFRPFAEMTRDQRQAFAEGVDRGYRAAGYDPSDEDPLDYGESYEDAASLDPVVIDGAHATALRSARTDRALAERRRDADRREALRTDERRAAFASYVRTGVQVQGKQQAALRVAERTLPLGASLHPAFVRNSA